MRNFAVEGEACGQASRVRKRNIGAHAVPCPYSKRRCSRQPGDVASIPWSGSLPHQRRISFSMTMSIYGPRVGDRLQYMGSSLLPDARVHSGIAPASTCLEVARSGENRCSVNKKNRYRSWVYNRIMHSRCSGVGASFTNNLQAQRRRDVGGQVQHRHVVCASHPRVRAWDENVSKTRDQIHAYVQDVLCSNKWKVSMETEEHKMQVRGDHIAFWRGVCFSSFDRVWPNKNLMLFVLGQEALPGTQGVQGIQEQEQRRVHDQHP